jgi:hypothetical protein
MRQVRVRLLGQLGESASGIGALEPRKMAPSKGPVAFQKKKLIETSTKGGDNETQEMTARTA